MPDRDRWRLTDGESHHEVTVIPRGFGHVVSWRVDGDEVAHGRVTDERATLTADEYGSIGLHFTTLGGVRRISLFDTTDRATAIASNQIPLSGTDFEPEPGSRAARRIRFMTDHPRLYTLRQVFAAAAGVAAGVAATWLLSWLINTIRWPDWQLTLPDWNLPSLPLPHWNLPAVPWPDWDVSLPEWALPPWLEAILSSLKYVVPVLVALGIAILETRRRRASDPSRRASHPNDRLSHPNDRASHPSRPDGTDRPHDEPDR